MCVCCVVVVVVVMFSTLGLVFFVICLSFFLLGFCFGVFVAGFVLGFCFGGVFFGEGARKVVREYDCRFDGVSGCLQVKLERRRILGC